MSFLSLDIFRYFNLFKKYLGPKIYIVIFLTLLASLFEGFGILLLLPLLGTISPDAASDSNFFTDLFSVFINYLGISGNITSILLLIGISFIMKGLMTFLSLALSASLTGKLLYIFKVDLLQKFLKMNFKYYSNRSTGHFTNLINEQPTRALEAFRQLTTVFGQAINAIILLTLATFSAWKFGLSALVAGVLLLIFFIFLSRYVRNLSRLTAKENGLLSSWLIQTLTGFKYLFSTSQLSLLDNKIKLSISKLIKYEVMTRIASSFTQSVREPLAVLFILLILFYQLVVERASLEPILVSIVLFYRGQNAILSIQSSLQATYAYIGSMEIVDEEFLKIENSQIAEGGDKLERFNSSLELKNISFKYDSKVTLENISVTINAKSTLALIGESGSGKSTFVDLITLLHQDYEGDIIIDGVNARLIDGVSWRNQIGYVSQDEVIFNDSIANNIHMWKGDHNEDTVLKKEIYDVLKLTNLVDLISDMPQGIDTQVGDRGMLLSGGQKQRLFLARELFRKPSIIILDEATSALDSISEKEIMETITLLKGRMTIVMIAHRLSTIKNVDEIIVLDKGKIIEKGSHETLSSNKRSYFNKLSELQKL